jgi:hypothetical protein
MIGEVLGVVLPNVPVLLWVAAVALAFVPWRGRSFPQRLLSWTLLLPIGATEIWAAFYHLVFPSMAAAYIGWQDSPSQFEVGMADLAIGITACLAFRRDLSFQAAAVCVAAISLIGDAAGHVRQMMVAGNFAPGNAGIIFYMDIFVPLLAIGLLLYLRAARGSAAPR